MMRVSAMPMAIAITTLASVLTVALNMRHQDHHIILVVVIIIILLLLVPSSFPQQQEQHQPKHQHLLMHMFLMLTSLIHQRYHHCHLYRHQHKSWPQHHRRVSLHYLYSPCHWLAYVPEAEGSRQSRQSRNPGFRSPAAGALLIVSILAKSHIHSSFAAPHLFLSHRINRRWGKWEQTFGSRLRQL